MSESTHTTIATWVMPILSAIKPFCDEAQALQQVGIEAQCITDANQRVSVDKMRKLWELAESVSGDDCIGLEVIKYISPTSFHALYNAHHAASSLRESLTLMVKFSKVISTAVNIIVRDEGDEVVVRLDLKDGLEEPSKHARDAFMALMVKSLSDVSHDGVKHLRSVKLMRDKPKDTARHDGIFHCPIEYNSDCYEARISKAFVDQYVPTGNAELARINAEVLSDYVQRFNKSDTVAAVYNILLKLMPQGEPSREKVADALGTSSRSLHRKLKELDTSFKTILDDTRKHLALQYIKESELSMTTITYQLGFSDSNSFSRSFKRWTGISPSEYRKNIH